MSITVNFTFEKKHFLMLGLILAIPFLILAINTIMAAAPTGQYHPSNELYVNNNLDMNGYNLTNSNYITTNKLDVTHINTTGNISLKGTNSGIIFPDGTHQKTAISLAAVEGNFLKEIVPIVTNMNTDGTMFTETNNMTDRDGDTYAWAAINTIGSNRGSPTSKTGTVIFNLPRPTYIEKINIRGTATNPDTNPSCPNIHRTTSYCCSTSNTLQISSDGTTYQTIGTIETNEYNIYDNVKSIKIIISGSCAFNSYGNAHTLKIYEIKAY